MITSPEVNAMRQIPNDYLAYPVLIQLNNGSIATGFYFDDSRSVYLVTARHVLFSKDAKGYALSSSVGHLTSYTHLGEQWKFTLDLPALLKSNYIKFHENADVCIVELGPLETLETGLSLKYYTGVRVDKKATTSIVGFRLNNIKKYASVLVGNTAYLFGYPVSLGVKDFPQIDYEKPLLRQGIVAGKNDTLHTIILDCPVFPGNSGGPAVEVEQEGLILTFRAIGVVSEYVPAAITWNDAQKGQTTNLSNSGYSIIVPLDRVLELLDKK
jgi:hypothetical protein